MCKCTITKQCEKCKKPKQISSWDMFADGITTTHNIIVDKIKKQKLVVHKG